MFCAEVENKFKQYFQYIAVDETQLCSRVVRLFKTKYPIDSDIDIETIVNDKVELYIHVTLKLGVDSGFWYKVGKSKDLGETKDITFRCHHDSYTNMKISHKWYIWKINQEAKDIGDLPTEYRKYPVGLVYCSESFYTRIATGKFPGLSWDVL